MSKAKFNVPPFPPVQAKPAARTAAAELSEICEDIAALRDRLVRYLGKHPPGHRCKLCTRSPRREFLTAHVQLIAIAATLESLDVEFFVNTW